MAVSAVFVIFVVLLIPVVFVKATPILRPSLRGQTEPNNEIFADFRRKLKHMGSADFSQKAADIRRISRTLKST